MTNFQIGAQMYSVRNHCQDAGEMLTCLKVLKTMGYNCCQLSAHSRDISAEQLRDMLDESGMTCACTHIGFQEMEEDIDKVIREHKLWNCAYPGIGGRIPRRQRRLYRVRKARQQGGREAAR